MAEETLAMTQSILMEEKIDARSLPREVLEEKRRQAHRLRKRGMTRAEIGEIVGVHADTVGRWLKLSSRQLKVNRGGRKKGEGRRLTQAQEDRLRKLITDKAPDQLKLNYALWTRKAVMELIEQEAGIRMPIRTVGEYPKRWGFTPQKPVKRAYEQNPKGGERVDEPSEAKKQGLIRVVAGGGGAHIRQTGLNVSVSICYTCV